MKNYITKFLLSTLLILVLMQTARAQTSLPETGDKLRRALAPYAQVVPNDSYTFIGVTHPSLDTALTQIGVMLEVRGMTTVPNNAAGRAAVFTIDAGETHRIFAVNVSHATINSSNAAFTDSRTHLILTADTAQFGNINIMSVRTHPTEPIVVGTVNKYANLSQLSIWGVVFIESSSTGFSLEFVGDAHDSTLGRGVVDAALRPISGTTTGAGRGIN